MTDGPATYERLRELLAKLSPGDLSIQEMLVLRPEATGVTSSGSPNDLFWSELVQLGWMTRAEEQAPVGGIEFLALKYALTPTGRFGLSRFLRRQGQLKQIDEAIRALYNTVGQTIARQLIEEVRARRGDREDLARILALISAKVADQITQGDARKDFVNMAHAMSIAALETPTGPFNRPAPQADGRSPD